MRPVFLSMSRVSAAVAITLWMVFSLRVGASDELARAKELYQSASYDEALGLLDSIPASADIRNTVEVHEYRVYCLVALDRREDAKQAMAALVTASPQYQMSEQMASPRVRTMFTDVRRSLLPSIVQGAYAEAKAAFDRKDPDAVNQFNRVLMLLKDPDVAGAAGTADLATVATGFRDLSAAMTRPPAPAPAVAPPARTVTAAAAKATIVPPVAISQVLPQLQMREAREWDGEVEVVIDEAGKVTGARMTKAIHPLYDAQLLRVAKGWTYKPALKDGVPTQMVKLVTIHLDSRPACPGQQVKPSCRPAGN